MKEPVGTNHLAPGQGNSLSRRCFCSERENCCTLLWFVFVAIC